MNYISFDSFRTCLNDLSSNQFHFAQKTGLSYFAKLVSCFLSAPILLQLHWRQDVLLYHTFCWRNINLFWIVRMFSKIILVYVALFVASSQSSSIPMFGWILSDAIWGIVELALEVKLVELEVRWKKRGFDYIPLKCLKHYIW